MNGNVLQQGFLVGELLVALRAGQFGEHSVEMSF